MVGMFSKHLGFIGQKLCQLTVESAYNNQKSLWQNTKGLQP
ncbi:hypothetical protein QWZ16_10920 [Vibrio ostreicida]|uniref:Uncharacterized protein n=1 Tax=Vibrio ostreicida TaxID=526588 RepID=A0ABT8BV05_9VIBR|nr:hypothetical protein [Vibrio ostreicida]MDN3610214.1 hypothetical protein [Vibrio ostreicida]